MMLVYWGCVFCVLTATVQGVCRLGYTGPRCRTSCGDGCAGDVCTLHHHGGIVCSRGCKDGWAGESCRTPCAEHCKRCNRTKSKDCEECQHSYYGETCSQNCKTCGPAGCDKDGMCRDRPTNCDGGVKCGKNCIKKCRFCKTDGTCSVCQRGFAGDNCEIPCTNCRGTCTQDGCSEGCLCGYYGQFCRDRCSNKCLASCSSNTTYAMCVRGNGSCVKGCKDGHFGEWCQHRCNTNCKACEQATGHCTSKCKDGHYGESCERECLRCKRGKCDKDGRCYHCQDGYYGPNCDIHCDSICTSCGRYSGVCQPQNLTSGDGGSVPLIQLPVAIAPTQSQRAATNGYGPTIKSAETKSEESRGLPSFVIWLCVTLGVLTVIALATIGVCCNRAKNRMKNTALLTRSISHRNNYTPELPSTVGANVSSTDYDEIPEMSHEIAGRSQAYVDEGQNRVRAVDTGNVAGVCMQDSVRRGKDVKYLSVTDVVPTEGYIDVIG